MIPNFPIQDQWLLEHQDKKLFDMLNIPISFSLGIPLDKLADGAIMDTLDYHTVRTIEHDGMTVKYFYYNKVKRYEFYLANGIGHGSISQAYSEPQQRIFGISGRFSFDENGNNEILFILVSYDNDKDGGITESFMLGLKMDSIKWFCILFYWDMETFKIQPNWENIALFMDSPELPEPLSKHLEYAKEVMGR